MARSLICLTVGLLSNFVVTFLILLYGGINWHNLVFVACISIVSGIVSAHLGTS